MVEPAGERLGEPFGLVAGDVEESERVDELVQMARSRSGDHEQAAGAEHAVELRGVARREHVQHDVGDPVGDRPRLPQVPHHGAETWMCPRGPAQRRSRHVEGEPGTAHGVEHAGEVVAGARARVDDQRSLLAPARVPCGLGQQRHERGVVPGREELGAGGDHLARVRGARGDLRVQQIDVTLLRDVERVPPSAPQRPSFRVQRRRAHGATQHRHDRGR
ncbi:hypothetical protein ACZ91_62895 [Streptomyces regensis]|nr:hypothetical protein ACZ91_62895 [Streptomyces regensis]